MSDPAKKTKQNKTPISLNKWVGYKGEKMVQATLDKLEQTGHDTKSIKNLEFKLLSPETYKMLGEAVQDAMLDHHGPSAKGYAVPVDLLLDLPDNSRLKVNYDPKTKGFSLVFGMRF